jgi:hypothetical protein
MRRIMQVVGIIFLMLGASLSATILYAPFRIGMSAFNSTIQNIGDQGLISQFNKHFNALNYYFWIIPAIFLIGGTILILLAMQEEDYYTGGY